MTSDLSGTVTSDLSRDSLLYLRTKQEKVIPWKQQNLKIKGPGTLSSYNQYDLGRVTSLSEPTSSFVNGANFTGLEVTGT